MTHASRSQIAYGLLWLFLLIARHYARYVPPVHPMAQLAAYEEQQFATFAAERSQSRPPASGPVSDPV